MKRYLHTFQLILPAFLALLLVSASCSRDDDDDTEPPVGRPHETLARTLVIYMAGENSLASFVAADSAEIAQGLSMIDDSCRVVLYIDDTKSSRICVGTKDKPLQTVMTYPDNVCSTDSAGMDEVLDYIFQNYPARHYGLVMWSHASGWVFYNHKTQAPRRSFGIDNGRRRGTVDTGLRMDIPMLAKVLARHPHLDYIFFDACFMQCVEVAYELRRVTDYVAGSPAEIPGDGAPYQYFLEPLCRPDADLRAAMQAYSDYYASGPGYSIYRGVELSAIKTSELDDLAEASRMPVQQLFGSGQLPATESVQAYCPLSNSTSYTEFFDMQHLFYENLPAALYDSWLQAYNAAVPIVMLTSQWFSAFSSPNINTLLDMEHTGGVSVFVPRERYQRMGWVEDYLQLEWARDLGMGEYEGM